MNFGSSRTCSAFGKVVACVVILSYGTKIGAADDAPLIRIATAQWKGKAGTLDHLYADASTSRLFIANQSNDTLDVFDLKGSRLLQQIPGQKSAHSVVYVPSLDRIFVSSGAGFCNVLDGTSYMLLKAIPVEGADSVRFDSRTGHVGVASRKSLTLLDTKTLEVIAQVALPGTPHGFQIAKSGTEIYVNSEPPTEVAVINAEKKAVVAHYTLAGGHKSVGPITLDEPNGRILVGLRAPPRLAVLDMASGKEMATAPLPEGADDMFLDAEKKLIYVSCSAGSIVVIRQTDASRYEPVAEVPTVKGAKTSYFEPTLKRLYLIVPRQPEKDGPELWTYARQP